MILENDSIVESASEQIVSIDEHVAEWQCLDGHEARAQWRKAEMCALVGLEPANGSRTDLTKGKTRVQEFYERVKISKAQFARYAKTWRTFGLVVPEETRLSSGLKFKHYEVAANFAVQPHIALREAADFNWSANELLRVLSARKQQTVLNAHDGSRNTADDDDDDPDLDGVQAGVFGRRPTPRRVKRFAAETRVRGEKFHDFRIPKRDYDAFRTKLNDLARVFGTKTVEATLIATVRRAHSEWVIQATDVELDDGELWADAMVDESDAVQDCDDDDDFTPVGDDVGDPS